MGLDGPSRTIIVEPVEQPALPAREEPIPERVPEHTPERPPDREPVKV
jgi:hypothetical protein